MQCPRLLALLQSPEQGLSQVKKTYTVCDMFSFGLIVKWLLVGVRDDVPFKDAQMDHIFREHSRLHSSAGSAVHPFVEDLSPVPPVFRTLIQGCTATDPHKRWDAKEAMRKLRSIGGTVRVTAADSVHRQSASHFPQVGSLRPPPTPQVGYHEPSPHPTGQHQQQLASLASSLEKFQGISSPTALAATAPSTYLGPAALSSGDSADFQVPSHFPQVGYYQPPPEFITISEAIQFPASSATSSHENPSALNIMKCFECHHFNCCVSDYNPCTADLEPRGFSWFMQPFCAFFGLRIPLECFEKAFDVCTCYVCYGQDSKYYPRANPCGWWVVWCTWPCYVPSFLSASLYFLMGLIMLPWSLCFYLAKMIRSCEKTCCGGPSTLFKCFYFPPLFFALSFYWVWKWLCCSRTCFGLCRGACGPDCNIVHETPCIVCGKQHDVKNNHRCEDGSRGSFAWNFEEGDPVCPC
jgi:hypothetical protein